MNGATHAARRPLSWRRLPLHATARRLTCQRIRDQAGRQRSHLGHAGVGHQPDVVVRAEGEWPLPLCEQVGHISGGATEAIHRVYVGADGGRDCRSNR
jgi:hypothetical protein